MESGLIAAAILALVGLLAEIISRIMAGSADADPELAGHVKEIQDLRKAAVEVRAEIEAQHRASTEAQAQLGDARFKFKSAERRAALVRPYHRLVVENGAPGPGVMRFDASVSHAKAGLEDMKADGKKVINPIYLKEVQVIIWAKSEDAAQKKLETLYPKTDGFDVTFHGPVFGATWS